jgi:site-specific DNA-cytosine methylase
LPPTYGADFAVRRLTPVECERLQGFPDNWTRIPYRGKPAEQCPDGPRYKACGNSMAVPVMRWIGERIQMMEDILIERDLFGEVDK